MKDFIITSAVLALLTALNLYGCDDGVREPRPFEGVAASVGSGSDSDGGFGADPCDPLPPTCEPFDSCPCVYGNPGEPARRGTVECTADGTWTTCGSWR